MKTTQETAAKIRSIIRWTAGTTTAAIIMTTACALFPLLSSFTAFSLTLCLAIYAGLQIALPPVDDEDDWVPVRAKVATAEDNQEATVVHFPADLRPAV